MPHHAVNLGSNGFGRNIIEYNEIRHVCMELQATAAINCWMDVLDATGAQIQRDAERAGHIIRYNLIADTWGCRVDEKGNLRTRGQSACIWMDDCTSNCVVYGNIIVRSGPSQNNNGKNNIVENNIIVDCKCGHSFMNWGSSNMANFLTGNRYCRNIIYFTDPEVTLFILNTWHDKAAEQIDYNLFYNKAGGEWKIVELMGPGSGAQGERKIISLAEWRKMGFDKHSVIADPLFVDPEHDDYRLQPESPAFNLGFYPIDVDKIGLRGKEQK